MASGCLSPKRSHSGKQFTLEANCCNALPHVCCEVTQRADASRHGCNKTSDRLSNLYLARPLRYTGPTHAAQYGRSSFTLVLVGLWCSYETLD
jgi:hypothetical protein